MDKKADVIKMIKELSISVLLAILLLKGDFM